MKKALNIVGILLIIIGLGILGNDYINKQRDLKAIEEAKKNLMEQIANPNPDANIDISEGILEWGFIRIEKIDIDNPVSISDDFDLLYRYLVAFKSSIQPPSPGNFVITGHNGACANCGFKNLKDLVNGDEITLIDRKGTYYYEVYDQFIVDKSEVWVLEPVDDEEVTLTLISCVISSTTDPRRIIIRAKMIDYIEKSPTN